MSDLTKFHNMTKPIKFRRLKMMKQYSVLWCKALRERIIYLINYLLYKIHILNRYSYRDNVEHVLPAPFKFFDKDISSKYFGGTINMQLVSVQHIDMDYFYYEKKDGSKKITLSLKDKNEVCLFTESHLENIHIKVGDIWYDVDHLPVFKMASIVNPEPVAFMDSDYIERPTESRTIDYDIKKLKTFCHKLLIGYMSPEYVSWEMYEYYFECSKREFEKYLDTLTLEDIMI